MFAAPYNIMYFYLIENKQISNFMKKFVLKKKSDITPRKRIGYKISYERELNAAQYEAVMHNNGPALVIAGAGTGKTRTLVYRVARLIEDGVVPESILLLTFTRKSASEMLRRASIILDGRCDKVSGGTFHSFALQLLRKYAAHIGFRQSFNILDQGDSEDVLNILRAELKLDKSKRQFPRKNTLAKILGFMTNKQESLENILEKDFPRYIDYSDEIKLIFDNYAEYKKKYSLMDYDDLLLHLLNLLKDHEEIRKEVNKNYKYIMVDEYQDTNRLQHEIVLKIAEGHNNIMAVGDDAQSIYSFRGANFQNIMFFPESFEKCEIFKIEENYRSTQPILNLTNTVIGEAIYKYEKELFTRKTGDELPMIVCAGDERQQSEFVSQYILELREEGYSLDDIAVLFRSGFHSFDLEIELSRANIPFRKFGGLKLMETAHIKDMLAYIRILFNPLDAVSWHRVLLLQKGIGPGTASQLIDSISSQDFLSKEFKIPDIKRIGPDVRELIQDLRELSAERGSVAEKASVISEIYKPLLKDKHDDWQKRWKDIETFLMIAEKYKSLREFLSDMALEPPTESLESLSPLPKDEEYLTLSTIHSAKGLEWKAVFLIWALEGRFPSSLAVESVDNLEEERRLFYVACTRAMDRLIISYPINIYDQQSGFILSEQSRFLKGVDETLAEKFVIVDESDDDNEDEELPLN